jgi:hypothetical protein
MATCTVSSRCWQAGPGTKNCEKVVKHRERKYGVTKFGLERFIRAPRFTLRNVYLKIRQTPHAPFWCTWKHYVYPWFSAALWVGIQKLYALKHGISMGLVTSNAYFYIALTAMIIGTQLFLAGFLADLIARNSNDRNNYLIAERINESK